MVFDDVGSLRIGLTITFGNVTLDVVRCTLSCGACLQDVSVDQADLFHLLAARAPHPVTRGERAALRGHAEANESDPYRKTVERLAAKLALVSDEVAIVSVGHGSYVLEVAEACTRRVTAAPKRASSQGVRQGRAR